MSLKFAPIFNPGTETSSSLLKDGVNFQPVRRADFLQRPLRDLDTISGCRRPSRVVRLEVPCFGQERDLSQDYRFSLPSACQSRSSTNHVTHHGNLA